MSPTRPTIPRNPPAKSTGHLDVAQDLLDEGGADTASVRGIARRLGVAPNAIYTYFPNKAALLEALVERLLGDVDRQVFAAKGRSWRDRAQAVALELRTHLKAHPGAVELILGSRLDGSEALTLIEQILELFVEAGLDPSSAARAAHVLLSYVLGTMALEVADLREASRPLSEEDRIAARRRSLADAPADRYPHTSAAADVMARRNSTEQYLWGLHRILDGITTAPGGTAEGAGCPRRE